MLMAGALAVLIVIAIGPDLRTPPRHPLRPITRPGRGIGPLLAGTGRARERERRRVVAGLPDTLELVARALRSGANLRGALADATEPDTPAARSLRTVIARLDAGDRLGPALDAWSATIDDVDVVLARAVLRLGDTTGAAVAGSLEHAATSLRDRAALSAEIAALSSQARLSAMVIGLAPLAFLTVSVVVDPDAGALLLTTDFGLLCLLGGLGLDAIGVRWMRRIGVSVTR